MQIIYVCGRDIRADDDLDHFVATDEGHFLLESVDGGEGVDFEVLSERSKGGSILRGDDIVGDDFPVGE